jgi:hypothetical protein
MVVDDIGQLPSRRCDFVAERPVSSSNRTYNYVAEYWKQSPFCLLKSCIQLKEAPLDIQGCAVAA